MILHGRNLIIKAGGVAIAAAKSCDINVQCEEIETATTSGAWRTALTGRKSWSVSTNQLVTSLVRPMQMVGSSTTLILQMAGEIGLPFDGFVDNPTVEQVGFVGIPSKIVWDRTRKLFLAYYLTKYYAYWSSEGVDCTPYTSPEDYQAYYYDGDVYTWLNNDIVIEKLTGNANVVNWRVVGTVGNFAQGSFQFNGNGALAAASLPST